MTTKSLTAAALLVTGIFSYSPVADAAQAINWVSPKGSGTACTQTKPCASAHAARSAVAGQTWYFLPGTYSLASPLTIANSGQKGAPITFSAAPGAQRQAILSGAGWKAVAKSHITLKGFKVQNVGGDGIRFECTPKARCENIRIEGNWTYKTRFSGIAVHGALFQNKQYGRDNVVNLSIVGNRVEQANSGGITENISVSNGIYGAEIAYNDVIDGYNLGIDVKAGARSVKIHHNTIRGHRGTAIYLDSSRRYVRDVDIYNNHIVGGSGSTGIRLAREVWSLDKNLNEVPRLESIKIYNNVIDGIKGAGIALQRIRVDNPKLGTYENIAVTNNTIVKSKSGVVVASHDRIRGIVVRNNIANTGGISYSFGVPVSSSHNISSDGSAKSKKAIPQFNNTKSGDYRLRTGSPGVDEGTDADAPRFDFDGASRHKGKRHDMGAFER